MSNIFPREYDDIPAIYRLEPHRIEQNGAILTFVKHARLRYWQRIRSNVHDSEILQAAADALCRGDPRFRFHAQIFDNPYRPTVVRLITVLRSDMWLPEFFVDCRYEQDIKWHRHLEERSVGAEVERALSIMAHENS